MLLLQVSFSRHVPEKLVWAIAYGTKISINIENGKKKIRSKKNRRVREKAKSKSKKEKKGEKIEGSGCRVEGSLTEKLEDNQENTA